MAVSDEFLEWIVDQFSMLGTVTVRRMFGGAGLYCDGRMFGIVADDTAYLKVDDSNREDFVRAGSSPFNPYPEIATGKSYYEIPVDILENPTVLAEWARRSLNIARRKK
jgi:DNA transformation protein